MGRFRGRPATLRVPATLWPWHVGPGRLPVPTRSISLPKRNYGHEKRQKELTRQRKKEEKLQRRLDRTNVRSENADPVESTAPDLPPEE
jgi:hypothetical protein